MAGPFYFAWCDEETPFDPAMHVEDEPIFTIEIEHSEGDFPSLTIEIANPRIGLLGPGRQQWCWCSWDNGTEIVPLFHGRLVGVPENLADEVVTLLFRAKPSDYEDQKAALADTLKVPPYWDPIWIQEGIDDPDTAWEARTELPHIDRVTLAVTSTSIIEGDDGTIDVSADEHFYDGVKVGYSGQPLRRIEVTGTATWSQTRTGEVDLTRRLVTAFQDAGSEYQYPMVSSYTADGLLDDWPEPLASLGGGWSMAQTSSAVAAEFVASSTYAVRYTDKSDSTTELGQDELVFNQVLTAPEVFFVNWKNFEVVFEIAPIVADFRLAYAAERKRTEVVRFTVEANIQSILTDPGAAEEETLDLSSAFIDQPVDTDEALPIGDPGHNCYFPTDRGKQSLEYLMMVARERLLLSARAVEITFASTWQKLAADISCRKDVLLHDYRLPAGQALGKIKSYRLMANGEGEMEAEATIGCMIGYGVALDEAAAGDDVYATGYATGYTATTGGEVAVIAGEVHYERLDGTYILDDDGVDLFNMTPETVINSLTVTDGPTDQRFAIDASLSATPDDVTLRTRGDVVTSGGNSSIENLADVTDLISGTTYNVSGIGIPNPWTVDFLATGKWSTTSRMLMTFNGTDGGPLNHEITAHANAPMQITSVGGAVLTPDPIGALELHHTIVALDLKPLNGDDKFMTEYDVVVLPIVVPMGINLEAA